MPFLALDLSLDLIRGLRPTIELLRRKSPRLRRQLEDSLAGIVQNVCEGSGRAGGDRPQLYRCALGSLREVNGILLAAVAFGTMIGGPLGDRIGRKYIIWASILGVLPFSLLLPHANLFWTTVLTVPIGVILASAFPAILVYAQELMPGRTGTVAGLFFGFAFGMGGIGAAVLGKLADAVGINTVYDVCAFLPLIGLLAALLPDVERRRPRALPA